MMQSYSEYLAKKCKNEKQREERLEFFDSLQDSIARNGAEALDGFFECIRSAVKKQKAFEFLADYVSFVQKEQPELNALATAINAYCLAEFEASAKESAASHKKDILLIPDNVKIESKHLGALSNSQFVAVFRELQELVIKIYEDIEKSPFVWGYPDFYITEGYYRRVVDFLFAFVLCGAYSDGKLSIDAKKFFANVGIKRHKKPELMIAGFEKMGFAITGFEKKAISFDITYPANPHVVAVLNTYVSELGENALHWSMGRPKWSFSYRLVEDASTQKYETAFLSAMDYASGQLREIQHWLHSEAAKYGFAIDEIEPMEKGCMLYKKGSKRFLLVGETDIDGVPTVFSKVIFRDIFEKEKEKVWELYRKFPDTFRSNCKLCGGKERKCTMRISYEIEGKPHRNCAYESFYFHSPSLEDIENVLRLFIVEYKIT